MAARRGATAYVMLITWFCVATTGVMSSACTPFNRDAERFSLAGMHEAPRLSVFPMMEKINAHFGEAAPAGVVVHDVMCRDSPTGCCDITVFVRSQTSDVDVMRQLYGDNEYGFMEIIDFEPQLVLDAGANVGLAARIFAAMWPRAQIISLEPDRANFAMLQLNAALAPTVQPVNVGLWDKPAYLHMVNPDSSGAWGMQARESAQPTDDSIQAVSITSLVTTLNLSRTFDILKVDIEGAEATVFKDPEFLAILPEVPLVSVEIHDRYQATATQVVTGAFANLAFNESRSGEYTIFTNAHMDKFQGNQSTQVVRMPFSVAPHAIIGSGLLVVVGAAAAWLALSLLSPPRLNKP